MNEKLRKEYRARIRAGMEVLGADRSRIGRVKTVRGDDFLLDRYRAAAVFVPFSFIDTVGIARVTLTVSGSKIAEMKWAGLNKDVNTTKPAGGEPAKH